MTPLPSNRNVRSSAAFTLLEVVLAITIAVGILVVALHFYSQAADLRANLLRETARLSSIRLVMDRLTADLRSAWAQPQIGFTGDSSSMRFVETSVPGWLQGRAGGVETDLKIVSYSTRHVVEGTNSVVLGLVRREERLLGHQPVPADTNAMAGVEATGGRGRFDPVIDAIRFVQFWYWDGSGWSDQWDSPDLPLGVEVNLGAEPLPEGTHPLDYPFELYRRIIHLPLGRRPAEQWDEIVTQTPLTEVTAP